MGLRKQQRRRNRERNARSGMEWKKRNQKWEGKGPIQCTIPGDGERIRVKFCLAMDITTSYVSGLHIYIDSHGYQRQSSTTDKRRIWRGQGI